MLGPDFITDIIEVRRRGEGQQGRWSLKKTPEEAILKMIFLLIHFPLLCGPQVDLWPFYGFLCKRFSLYINRPVDHTGET